MKTAATLPAFAILACVLVTGCGNDLATVSSSQAKESVSKAASSFEKALSGRGMGQTSAPWSSSTGSVSDPDCGSGGSRWRSVGALTVADPSKDGDGAVAKLVGVLRSPWKTEKYVGDLDDDPVLVVPVTYGSGDATVAGEVTVVPAEGGWTYSLSVRSACIDG